MNVGFTGTQDGMTVAQKRTLRRLLRGYLTMVSNEFHHGDCIGSDEQAHDIAQQCGYQIFIHPPENESKRAWCKDYDYVAKPKPYLVRNKDIVNETNILIATPKSKKEERRSGTWSTIRYAERRDHVIHVILPDGKISDLLFWGVL